MIRKGPSRSFDPRRGEAATPSPTDVLHTYQGLQTLRIEAGVAEGHVVARSHSAGSPTVWFAITGSRLLVGPSQSAIIRELGDFRLSSQAVNWMLSSGTLGPSGGWDERLCRLPPDAELRLDPERGRVGIVQTPIRFEPTAFSPSEYKRQLVDAVESAVSELDLTGRWAIPLSGGVDSRAILLLVRRRQNLPCLTWTTAASRSVRGSDATIARRLATHFGLDHREVLYTPACESFETLIDRFAAQGEGRIDHLAGYLDGFRMWNEVKDSGITGIVRGDEAFGWEAVSTEIEVRHSLGLVRLTDYQEWRDLVPVLGERHGAQTLPDEFTRTAGESLATWRDRLYQAFRIPAVLAPLTDLKAPFVDVATPFLHPRVLAVVRRLPDELRTDKRLFREVVETLGPPIPYATRASLPALSDCLSPASVRQSLVDELGSAHAESVLSKDVCQLLRAEMVRRKVKSPLGRVLRRMVPAAMRRGLRQRLAPRLATERLALRAFLVSRMTRRLDALTRDYRHSERNSQRQGP